MLLEMFMNAPDSQTDLCERILIGYVVIYVKPIVKRGINTIVTSPLIQTALTLIKHAKIRHITKQTVYADVIKGTF